MLNLIGAVAGPILNGLFNVVDQAVEDKDAAVIRAEATGESWLQRNWRPLLMCLFGVIIANNYIIVPLFSTPKADIPPDMWELLKLGVGGYVVGRSVEKGIKVWKKDA